MSQTSRIVTIVDGVEVMEVTIHDRGGDPVNVSYYVHGQKYRTLREAREAAKGNVRRLTFSEPLLQGSRLVLCRAKSFLLRASFPVFGA